MSYSYMTEVQKYKLLSSAYVYRIHLTENLQSRVTYGSYRSSQMLRQNLMVRYCEQAKMMVQKESIAEKLTDLKE